jgi:hypothetical protein
MIVLSLNTCTKPLDHPRSCMIESSGLSGVDRWDVTLEPVYDCRVYN